MNQEKFVQQLKNEYTDKAPTKVDTLVELDKKVKRPALITAIIVGIVGALVLGVGMCLAMGVLEMQHGMVFGIVIGLVGMAICGVNYFLYKALVKRGKAKYGAEILRLSSEILGE